MRTSYEIRTTAAVACVLSTPHSQCYNSVNQLARFVLEQSNLQMILSCEVAQQLRCILQTKPRLKPLDVHQPCSVSSYAFANSSYLILLLRNDVCTIRIYVVGFHPVYLLYSPFLSNRSPVQTSKVTEQALYPPPSVCLWVGFLLRY